MRRILTTVLIAVSIFFFSSCSENKSKSELGSPVRFSSLSSSETNIKFKNVITEDDTISLVNNAYVYMGSGVGIGDFNNDGMPDVFFGANQLSSKLYVNKGNLQFEDITEKAGLSTATWITGVSIVDINNDGFDDIYLCASVHKDAQRRTNKLFVNQGDLTFKEMGKEYGLNDTSYSAQAVFFDYDKDGDLDMYLLNHLMDHKTSNDIVRRNPTIKSPARDKLYRNNGANKMGHPYFEEVSAEAGIIEDGYGLGVSVSDINNDGWPDIYVANDYLANDLLWINNKNGTFSNTLSRSTKHQSYSSMGVDANDINNDGLTDIVSLDMMPEDNYRQKMMYTFLNYDRYVMERRAGYEPQFIRNMLQLNNGVRDMNDTSVVFFSEVGQLAGISETDWSWSVLMADLDNDGFRDIHITNGMGRDMINSDFINYYAASVQRSVSDFKAYYRNLIKKLNSYGSVELHNYCYRNNGGLSFTDVSKISGIGDTAISNGCAYADLDNDGDLDLVVNNINKEAFILRNDARASLKDSLNNFIDVELTGDSLNKKGFGARVSLLAGEQWQFAEQYPVRGYLSTVGTRLHFGLGAQSVADSLKIVWPNGKQEILTQVASNSLVKFNYKNAVAAPPLVKPITTDRLFTDISDSRGIEFKHKETFFYDYGYQQLLPQKYSQLGPFITEGDINGDGLTDFFVGGAKGQWGRLFIQQKEGSFISKALGSGNKPQEDLGCLLFDADGDSDLDLFINSGGLESAPGSSDYLPRLYLNDGKGNFSYDMSAIPQTIFTSAQCVAAGDYDKDGDMDLFIGGRLVPRQYPAAPNSYLLRNNGGKFSIVTQEVCPELENAGMITSAVWTDFDGDKELDLIIAGEWMPIRFFKNDGAKLSDVSAKTGLNNLHGQWRSLQVADIDKDGDLDIVAGNLGLNNHYKASSEYPIKLFAKDIDGNGSIDPIIAYYREGTKGKKELFPGITREQFAAQVPLVKKKYLYNRDYAISDMDNILTGTPREDLIELTCNETRSVWLENKGGGNFVVHALPREAQFAPVNSIICTDANNDGNIDLIIAGNEYQADVMTGQYDASYGLLLAGDGKGNFAPVSPVTSGLIIDGDVKDLKLLRTNKNERVILAAVNDEQLKTFLLR